MKNGFTAASTSGCWRNHARCGADDEDRGRPRPRRRRPRATRPCRRNSPGLVVAPRAPGPRREHGDGREQPDPDDEEDVEDADAERGGRQGHRPRAPDHDAVGDPHEHLAHLADDDRDRQEQRGARFAEDLLHSRDLPRAGGRCPPIPSAAAFCPGRPGAREPQRALRTRIAYVFAAASGAVKRTTSVEPPASDSTCHGAPAPDRVAQVVQEHALDLHARRPALAVLHVRDDLEPPVPERALLQAGAVDRGLGRGVERGEAVGVLDRELRRVPGRLGCRGGRASREAPRPQSAARREKEGRWSYLVGCSVRVCAETAPARACSVIIPRPVVNRLQIPGRAAALAPGGSSCDDPAGLPAHDPLRPRPRPGHDLLPRDPLRQARAARRLGPGGVPAALSPARLGGARSPGPLGHDARGSRLAGLRKAGAGRGDVAAVGIANQRETTLLWERRDGPPAPPGDRLAGPAHRRRPAPRSSAAGLGPLFRRRTGLLLDPYFSGTKLAWLLDHVPGARRRRAARGELAFGTVDTWLLWKLTGGRVHATDVSNASRTLLAGLRHGRLGRRAGPGPARPAGGPPRDPAEQRGLRRDRRRSRPCAACPWPGSPGTSRPPSSARDASGAGWPRTPTGPGASCS